MSEENAPPRRRGFLGPGPGRPKGSLNKRTKQRIEAAEATGLLPHEILLSIARGEPQMEVHVNPITNERVVQYTAPADLPQRLQAATSAAPYYAPKLQTVEVIQGLNDDSLDSLIAQLASEAGISLAADGEGEEEEDSGTESGGGSRPRRRIILPD